MKKAIEKNWKTQEERGREQKKLYGAKGQMALEKGFVKENQK